MAELIPWFADPPDFSHSLTGDALAQIWVRDGELGAEVASLPWVIDGITPGEREGLQHVAEIAEGNPRTARLALQLPWAFTEDQDRRYTFDVLVDIAVRYPRLGERAAALPWLKNEFDLGMMSELNLLLSMRRAVPDAALRMVGLPWYTDPSNDPACYYCDSALASTALMKIARLNPEMTMALMELPWLSYDLDGPEAGALAYFSWMVEEFPGLAAMVATAPWFTDGINLRETIAVHNLRLLAQRDVNLAMQLLLQSFEEHDHDRVFYAIDALAYLGQPGEDETPRERGLFDLITGMPWFTDGLAPHELIWVMLSSPPDDLALDVLETEGEYQWHSRTVTLPLTGEVDLWVVSHKPFPAHSGDREAWVAYSGEGMLDLVEQGVRGAERVMGAAFPTTDVVLQVYDTHLYGAPGWEAVWGYDHVSMASRPFWARPGTLFHEIAHYYLHTGPSWFEEGGADFIENEVKRMYGLETEEAGTIREDCVTRGYTTVRSVPGNGWFSLEDGLEQDEYIIPSWCNYDLGFYLLASLRDVMGQAAFSSALTAIHLDNEEFKRLEGSRRERYPDEETIYRIFLEHTPSDRREAFRDVYRRIHGGTFDN